MAHNHGTTPDTGTTSAHSADLMPMSSMAMTFFLSPTTPLYSLSWTPASTPAYAFTCIFLVFLAVVFRGLLGYKSYLERRWVDADFNRRYAVVQGKERMRERVEGDGEARRLVLSANGVEEEVVVVQRRGGGVRPWRWSVDAPRAGVDAVVVGVGYLLMLAVMTMNLGYFLSVLGGTFLGSLVLGRYAVAFDHGH